ncbi:unnamed protein product [Durusdinium trenchii]|uniref:Pentatricopeptide repeat-containing protein, chloroplastic n=1 Tax=Durusdinium trenchii TaxID=1381693 RepID=A0ABP0QSV2_9DINO
MYSAAVTILDVHQWPLVLELLEASKRHGVLDVEVVNNAMAALKDAGFPELSASLFHSVDGLQVDLNACSFNTAIHSCSLAGNWLEAIQLLKAMWTELTMPDIISYNTVIWACSTVGGWRVAMDLLHEVWLEGLPASMYTFTGAILACAKAGQWPRALQLLSDARTELLLPDVPSHAAAIHACSQAAQWQQSLLLLKDMAGHKTWPDAVTFNSVIISCARGLQWRWSLRLVSDMVLDQVPPDVVTYRAMVDAYQRSWKWKEALQAVMQLEYFTGSIDIEGRTAAMNAMGTCRQWRWAIHLLREMGPEADVVAWNQCINACAKGRSWKQALQLLFDELQQPSLRGTLEGFNAALGACAAPQAMAWQAAMWLLEEMAMHRVTPDVKSITGAVRSCSGAQWQQVLNLSEKAEKDAILQIHVLSQVHNHNWPLALHLLQGSDAELGGSAAGCSRAVAIAEEANAGIEGVRWLERAQGCLSCTASDALHSGEVVVATELLLEHGRLCDQQLRTLGRRVVQPVLWRMLAIQAPPATEHHRIFERNPGLPGIRGRKDAARWKMRYLQELRSPSRSGAELSDLAPLLHLSLGSIGTRLSLLQVGSTASGAWDLFSRQAGRGALMWHALREEVSPVAGLPSHLFLSLPNHSRKQLVGRGALQSQELPATAYRFSEHSERQALLLVLKALKDAARIRPLEAQASWDSEDDLDDLESDWHFPFPEPERYVRYVPVLQARPPQSQAGQRRSSTTLWADLRVEAENAEVEALVKLRVAEQAMVSVQHSDGRQWLQLAQEAFQQPGPVRSRASAAGAALASLDRAEGEDVAEVREALADARRALRDALVWRCQEVSRPMRSRDSFKKTMEEALGEPLTQAQWSEYFRTHNAVVAKVLPELDFKAKRRRRQRE